MKKLNTIFSFVLLSFCLFINVSFADSPYYSEELKSKAITKITSIYDSNTTGIKNLSYYSFCHIYNSNYSEDVFYLFFSSEPILFNDGTSNYTFTTSSVKQAIKYVARNGSYYSHTTLSSATVSMKKDEFTLFYSNCDIYGSVSGDLLFSNTIEPDTPTMPTNADIASAVQMFYNSVYQLPNTAFKDFVVLYDKTTGLYTYIGHTRGNALGQVIVEPNGYYEGYKFDAQWWKFFLDEQNDSWDWQNLDSYFNYYVYTSDGTIENLNYVGKSNINGLIEKSGPWATANTVIVYSTNDYPVKYVTFSEDSPDPDIQIGTIQGDQYTYDENLDITDNYYNPLDNFISINYPSTLVGNADFDSFLNTFNDNKDVLILPSDANWVILANNSLFEHFSSFIIMCTVFIILQRVMRG